MKALEVEFLKVFDTCLAMRVAFQDDSLIKRGEFSFTASNGVVIESHDMPNFEDDWLMIRGESEKYDRIASACWYNSELDRDLAYSRFTDAIDEINRSFAYRFTLRFSFFSFFARIKDASKRFLKSTLIYCITKLS